MASSHFAQPKSGWFGKSVLVCFNGRVMASSHFAFLKDSSLFTSYLRFNGRVMASGHFAGSVWIRQVVKDPPLSVVSTSPTILSQTRRIATEIRPILPPASGP